MNIPIIVDRLLAAELPVMFLSTVTSQPPASSDEYPTTYHTILGAIFRVVWSQQPTAGQDSQAASIITTWAAIGSTKRTLLAIYSDLNALTTTQKTNIWTNLTSGSPPLISTDAGFNSGLIFLLWRIAQNASLSAAVVTDMKITAAAYYVQDNPIYLVTPAFDLTINVAGVQ